MQLRHPSRCLCGWQRAPSPLTAAAVALRFKQADADDAVVKKTTSRELMMLRKLRHRNIVSLLEAFRRKGKVCMVFE